MFDKRVAKYLDKIVQGKPINYSTFLSLLPEGIKEEVNTKASIEFLSKGSLKVDIRCPSLLEKLHALTIEPDDRVNATLLGDSHKVNTSNSVLLAYHKYSTDIHPDTVISSQNKLHIKFKPKTQLIIIENSELFFAKEKLLRQMNKAFSLSLSFEQVDLVYAAGNQISNNQNFSFLDQYESVLCFFDYDVGGLKIFKALQSMLGGKVKFLEPTSDNLNDFFVKKPKNTEHFTRALEDAKSLGLRNLYQVFKTKKSFMEQEALLAL